MVKIKYYYHHSQIYKNNVNQFHQLLVVEEVFLKQFVEDLHY
ncbi:unnamed protein product [Schistosoma margrebowiei]|uniref:Uncharacterized protein n=1 Tax=Schistosoma margrebowiei TaxID=48269 RepID=A0A3P8FVE6_9TREM|nr:unnamed protein product [Schistosoma margrebowiei]